MAAPFMFMPNMYQPMPNLSPQQMSAWTAMQQQMFQPQYRANNNNGTAVSGVSAATVNAAISAAEHTSQVSTIEQVNNATTPDSTDTYDDDGSDYEDDSANGKGHR